MYITSSNCPKPRIRTHLSQRHLVLRLCLTEPLESHLPQIWAPAELQHHTGWVALRHAICYCKQRKPSENDMNSQSLQVQWTSVDMDYYLSDLDLEISIPPVKAFGGMSRNLKHCCQVAGWISCHLRNRQDPLLQASLARFPKRIENLGGEQLAMWRYFCFIPSPSPSQRKQQRRMKKASKSIHKI